MPADIEARIYLILVVVLAAFLLAMTAVVAVTSRQADRLAEQVRDAERALRRPARDGDTVDLHFATTPAATGGLNGRHLRGTS